MSCANHEPPGLAVAAVGEYPFPLVQCCSTKDDFLGFCVRGFHEWFA